MIIDFHTHIFPPHVRDNRDDYLARDRTFAEMYADPRAKIATAEDLLQSMDESGVDASVALGFAWTSPDDCRRHNDYLLEAAARSNGRIIPFCTVNPAAEGAEDEIIRCAEAGARGLGELRPDSQGWSPVGEAGHRLSVLALDYGLFLLFHVTEPVGHDYPGKHGGSLSGFYEFCLQHPEAGIVGAHLAGGLPLYMPHRRVREAFTNLYVDTAAQPLLYDAEVYGRLQPLIRDDLLLFGSDFPLVEQSRQISEIRDAIRDEAKQARVLGGTAAWLLGLTGPGE
jgi:uncharacterized protein